MSLLTDSNPVRFIPERPSDSPTEPRTIVLRVSPVVFAVERDAWTIVREIERHTRAGTRVVVVLTGLLNQSERLLAGARRITDNLASGSAIVSLIASGGRAAAALLALALERSSIQHVTLDASSAGFTARGPNLAASPASINTGAFAQAFSLAPVVLFPGLEALLPHGEPALLGEGGVDLTAAFIADALRADAVFLNELDGVYESDPLRAPNGAEPWRYQSIRWDQARALASPGVAHAALAFAESRGLSLRVRAPGSCSGTLITSRTVLAERFRRGDSEARALPIPA